MQVQTCHGLQVRSIGKRDYNPLFKLGDEMIQFQGLHRLLAIAVSEMVPVNVAVLLSEDIKRQVCLSGVILYGVGWQVGNFGCCEMIKQGPAGSLGRPAEHAPF